MSHQISAACLCQRFSRNFSSNSSTGSSRGKFAGKYQRYGNKEQSKGTRLPLPEIHGEIIWGIHPVTAAISANQRQPFTAFFKHAVNNARLREIKALCTDKRIPTLDVTGNVLDEMSGNHPHQGVCLDASPLVFDNLTTDTDINRDTLYHGCHLPAVWMLPYKVQDTMNMGNILRSAHFFGVRRVLLPAHYSSSLNPVVSKASAGALEMMDIKTLKNRTQLTSALMKWQDHGGRVVGTTCDQRSDKAVAVSDYIADKPTLVIVGNEAKGIDQGVTDLCDDLLYVHSCHGDEDNTHDDLVDSLNVSVATGIILHAVVNSRKTY